MIRNNFSYVVIVLLLAGIGLHPSPLNSQKQNADNMEMVQEKMKVEIWSDIACPFCYIGKRNFETALSRFPHKDKVEVTWRSFQITPDAKHVPGMDNNQALADHLQTTVEQAKVMNNRVTVMAKNAGLTYNMDILVWANTFDAHRLIQYSNSEGGNTDKLKERLFQSHFTNGENLEDYETLVKIATEAGLAAEKVKEVLASGQYADEVRNDIREARNNQVSGVPAFLIDKKVLFSGAKPVDEFAHVLQTAFENWEK